MCPGAHVLGFSRSRISSWGKIDVAAVRRYYSGKAEVSGFDVAEQTTASAERAIRHPEQCPHCGSPDVRRTRRLLGFAISAALLIAVGVAVDQLVMIFYLVLAVCIFFLVASPYRCADCGHRW